MLLKKKRKSFENLFDKKLKILLIASGYFLVFMLGAYLQKNHFFYTTIKPLLFENIKFVKKIVQGKFQPIDKIYLNINFENYEKLNKIRASFLKENKIIESQNEWVTANIKFKNNNYEAKIRLKGRVINDHLNPSMRKKNISYKVKIKKKEKGNILGLREFNLMDIRRRGYLLEWYAREFLKNEGLIHLQYKFVNLFINGSNYGTYVLDENFSETTLTRNKRRNGIAVRFDNNYALQNDDPNVDPAFKNDFASAAYDNLFSVSQIDLLNDNISNFKELILNNSNNLDENVAVYFDINGNEKKVLIGPDKNKIDSYYLSAFLLNKFRDNYLKFEDIFNIDQTAKGFAASDILDGWHGINWTNLSFYFNPVTNKFEPIFQDWYNEAFISKDKDKFRGIRILDLYNYGDFYKKIFNSKNFKEKYVYYLEKYSKLTYLEKFEDKIQREFNSNLRKIHKSSPYYNFPKYLIENKINSVQTFLNHHDPVYFELSRSVNNKKINNELLLRIGNKHVLPINVEKIIFNSPKGEVFETIIDKKIEPRNLEIFDRNQFDKSPVKYKKLNIKNPEFNFYEDVTLQYKIIGSEKLRFKKINKPPIFTDLKIKDSDFFKLSKNLDTTNKFNFIKKNNEGNYIIDKGNWFVREDLIIPSGKKLIIKSGTNINITNKARILSKSPIIAVGTNDEMINFIGKGGRCLILSESKDHSKFENVNFYELEHCYENGINSEGSFNVYNSEIDMKNIFFYKNLKGDDGINFVNSKFNIENILFKEILSDCLDIDYSIGKIKNIQFQGCGNDGLDISNTSLNLVGFESNYTGDKSISSGENSILRGKNIKIDNSFMGLGIKDGSEVNLDEVKIYNSKFPVAVYIKKQTYGFPKLDLTNYENLGKESEILEAGVKVNINNNIQKGNSKNVFKKIYE